MPNLSDDAKRQLLESHLARFAVDAYGHTLNREVAVAADDSEAVARADDALAQIAVATSVFQQQLDALPVVEAPVVEPVVEPMVVDPVSDALVGVDTPQGD